MPIIFFTIWIVVAIDAKILFIFLGTTRPIRDRVDTTLKF